MEKILPISLKLFTPNTLGCFKNPSTSLLKTLEQLYLFSATTKCIQIGERLDATNLACHLERREKLSPTKQKHKYWPLAFRTSRRDYQSGDHRDIKQAELTDKTTLIVSD